LGYRGGLNLDFSTILNIFLFTLVGWFFYKRIAPVKGLKNLTQEKVCEKVRNGNSILVDVRESHEFKNGYIPKAINIPLSKLKERLNEVLIDKELILYCQSGMRSKQAARIFQSKKYTDISHLTGGISSWSGKEMYGNR